MQVFIVFVRRRVFPKVTMTLKDNRISTFAIAPHNYISCDNLVIITDCARHCRASYRSTLISTTPYQVSAIRTRFTDVATRSSQIALTMVDVDEENSRPDAH